MELLDVYSGSHRMALCEQFVVDHAARIPPTAEENFPSVDLRLRLRWRLLLSRQPVGDTGTSVVLVRNPALVYGHEAFQEFLTLGLEKQRLTNGHTSGPAGGSQLVG